MKLQPVIVVQTFRHLVTIAPEVVQKFFDLIGKIYPEFNKIFAKVDIDKLSNKFINALIFVIDHLDEEPALRKYLNKLGKKHKELEFEPQYYARFKDTFLRTIASYLNEKWTPKVAEQWSLTFDLICNYMLEGAGVEMTEPVTIVSKNQSSVPKAKAKPKSKPVQKLAPKPEVQGEQNLPQKETPEVKPKSPPQEVHEPEKLIPVIQKENKLADDSFTPYSKEFFESIKLEIPLLVHLSDDQKKRIKSVACDYAKKLVEKYWTDCYNKALAEELSELEEKESKKSSEHKAA